MSIWRFLGWPKCTAVLWAALALLLPLSASRNANAEMQVAVEYYFAAWDHYFVTALSYEIAMLDGVSGGDWKRTGQTFNVWSQSVGGALPTCRFFSTSFAPKSSHFYTPFAAECAAIKGNANWQYEAIAFYVQLPDAAGMCSTETVPLYRLYNNGKGLAPNHRYTTSRATFDQMRAAGWVFEGHGITGAFACVPPGVGAIPDGFWSGSISGGQNIDGVILDTGVFYFFTSSPVTHDYVSILQGTLSSSDSSTFTSLDARSFILLGGLSVAPLSGSYLHRTSISGTFAEWGMTRAFSVAYDSDYEKPASLAAVSGTFAGVLATTRQWDPNTVITIAPSGLISGTSGNGPSCRFTGNASPHGSVNVFDITLTFGGSACIFVYSDFVGIAFYDDVSDELVLFAPNPSRSDCFAFAGTRR